MGNTSDNITDVARERLSKLADLLENFDETKKELTTPITRFKMYTWYCGTAACAAGTAALHPWFIERGLRLEGKPSSMGSVYYFIVFNEGDKQLDNIEACAAFFDISYKRASYFFLPESYGFDRVVTPTIVARRIREYLA